MVGLHLLWMQAMKWSVAMLQGQQAREGDRRCGAAGGPTPGHVRPHGRGQEGAISLGGTCIPGGAPPGSTSTAAC